MATNDRETSASFKVLMTADAVGGVWQYSVDLATALACRGVELLLATMGPRPSAAQKTQVESVSGVRISESDYALEWMPGAEADFTRSGDWLLQLEREFAPDIIHLNGYSHAALDWHAPVLSVAHSCVFSWWRAVHGSRPGEDWTWYGRAVAAGIASATDVAAPTRAMADALAREYDFDASRIRVIHNAVSSSVSPDREKLPFCFAAGRFDDEAKNIRLLDAVAPSLDWPVRVAGTKGEKSSDALSYLGYLPRPKLVRNFETASIFLHPALYEPFGLSVLEAARARCCLLLSDIASLRELWDGCAQFADPRDPEQWTFEANRLARNCGERTELAEKAYRHSLRYSIPAMASAYLAVYQDVRRTVTGGAAA